MGGAKKKLIENVFILQKRAVRCLFGDRDSFINKFCTAARTRQYGEQFNGESFYQKEHTKPLFSNHKLLTVSNLYKYMATNEIGKIIVSQCPAPLYNSIKLSIRNTENLIILNNKNMPHNQSFNISCSTWNMLIRRLNIPIPRNIVPCILKYKLKRYLLQIQSEGDPDSWNPNN